MNSENSVTNSSRNPSVPVAPLPHSLDESNGTIFEVYPGGKTYQPTAMHWERLKTVTVTREDQCSVEVHINQGRRKIILHRDEK